MGRNFYLFPVDKGGWKTYNPYIPIKEIGNREMKSRASLHDTHSMYGFQPVLTIGR